MNQVFSRKSPKWFRNYFAGCDIRTHLRQMTPHQARLHPTVAWWKRAALYNPDPETWAPGTRSFLRLPSVDIAPRAAQGFLFLMVSASWGVTPAYPRWRCSMRQCPSDIRLAGVILTQGISAHLVRASLSWAGLNAPLSDQSPMLRTSECSLYLLRDLT